jgi:predicted alpha/beta superfamily hydrolase
MDVVIVWPCLDSGIQVSGEVYMKMSKGRTVFGLVGSMFSFQAFTQSTITLQVKQEKAVTQTTEPLYVAGSFNQWQPASSQYQLQPDKKGNWFIKIRAAKDAILEFKFTRGGWDKVEVLAGGSEVPNHLLKVTGDTSVTYTIESWRDKVIAIPRQHTASPQVQLLDTAFHLEALHAQRRIWLYLPKDYTTTTRRYPVLYMQDGQNLFDNYMAAYGEWGVDKMLDSLFDATGKSCIVVAIDHGGTSRLTDYNPYNHVRYGRGNGRLYVKSIVESVKPFIDERFRTLPDAPNTWMAGSSMGGLIAMGAVMQYPTVFGAAAILSPSFWMAPQLKADVAEALRQYQGRLFFYAGGMEGRNMVPDMDAVINRISPNSKAAITRRVVESAGHNEAAWRAVFPEFLKWILD